MRQAIAKYPLHLIEEYLTRWLGSSGGKQLRVPDIWGFLRGFTASFLTIGLLTYLSYHTQFFVSNRLPTLIPSFASSAVLLYGAADLTASMPRNFVFGYLLVDLMCISLKKLFICLLPTEDHLIWFQIAFGLSLSMLLMELTNTTHPPAAASALIILSGGPTIYNLGFMFLVTPILFGLTVQFVVALIVNNIGRRYPEYWFS
ncbi:hypothetical protein K493DRAFT_256939, partial [Basidiobolus meristosporus CBS 931.73]